MRLILVDPPGTGKSTRAAILSEKLGVPHISTDGLSRVNTNEGIPFDVEAKSYIGAGNFVPDDVTIRVVKSRLNGGGAAKGFLLDGFPHTVGQAEELKRLLSNLGAELDAAVQFDVSKNAVVEHMLARGRADGTEEIIRDRMHMCTSETVLLLDYYSERIIKIAARGSIEGINGRTMTELGKLDQALGVPITDAPAFLRRSGRQV